MQNIPLMMFQAQLIALRDELYDVVVNERPVSITGNDAKMLALQANAKLTEILMNASHFDRRFLEEVGQFKFLVADNDEFISITGSDTLTRLFLILKVHPVYFVFKKEG